MQAQTSTRPTARGSTEVVSCSSTTLLPDSLPEKRSARQALEDLKQGCAAFEALAEELPRGVDEAVKGLRSRIQELEALTAAAAKWEKKCPEGGQLLWVQMSPAAGDEEPPDWALGQLFVTKTCLLFEANESPSWSLGPVMWKDVVRVEMLPASNDVGLDTEILKNRNPCDIRMQYRGGFGGPSTSLSTLRLQLALVDMAWVERALPTGAVVVVSETAPAPESAPAEETKNDESGSGKPGSFRPRKISTDLAFNRECTMQITKSFYDVAAKMTSAQAPRLKDPVCSCSLPDATLEGVCDAITVEGWLVEDYVKDALKAVEITSTPWADSKRLPGTHMSRTKWSMPLPDDLPEEVGRLVELPDNLQVTLMSRLHFSDLEIVLAQRGYCGNVKYGDQFIVQCTFAFRPQDDASVLMDVFNEVVWSTELPDSHCALSDIIEKLSRQHATAFAKRLAKLLGGGDEGAPLVMGPVASSTPAPAVAEAEAAPPAPPAPPPPMLEERIHLTGLFAKWATDFEGGRLTAVPGRRPGFALLRLCVRLTSESFTFAVVSGRRKWDWRLFPRDAVPIKIGFIKSHVSKEGMLTKADPDAVVVALGNLSIGHGLNFHVLEKEGTVVTIWVEVPANEVGGKLELNVKTAEGAKVWYTKEDTGVHHSGGDGMDLSKYRKWLPPRDP